MTTPLVTILDDEPAIRTMLADALEDAGFRTMCFGRAREFEAALQKHTPDVCLVDLSAWVRWCCPVYTHACVCTHALLLAHAYK